MIAHYDQQTEEEAAAEIESAPEAMGDTWMCVPAELVGAVTRLIEDYAKNVAPSPARKPKKKALTRKPRK